jgi:hypothetical protein
MAKAQKSHPRRSRAHDGQMGEGGRRPHHSVKERARQTPLDFALGIMCDDSKPDALRASMAKAAMPFLHKRGEERHEQEDTPPREPMSDLELARRIARILELGRQQAEREGKAPPTIGKGDTAPEPVPSGPPRAPAVNAGPAQRPPPAPPKVEAGRIQPIDPFDPHPNYRWI